MHLVVGVLVATSLMSPPPSLARLLARENELQTARFEWSLINHQDEDGREMFFSSQWGPTTGINIGRGDFGGAFYRGADGKPDDTPDAQPQELWDGEVMWWHNGDSLLAQKGTREWSGRLPRLKGLGLAPWYPVEPIPDLIGLDRNAMRNPRKYEVEHEGATTIVRAHTDQGILAWELDDNKGGMPRRASLLVDGRVVAEARSTLRKFDGVWFPERVEYYQRSFANGAKPIRVVNVYDAQFNRPTHQTHFTPNDIGVDVGHNVRLWGRDGPEGPLMRWDGEKAITQDEYRRRVLANEMRPGPRLQLAIAKARALERRVLDGTFNAELPNIARYRSYLASKHAQQAEDSRQVVSTASPSDFETEWEAYTREFIAKYKLDAAQTQKAWLACKEAQSRARRYLARRKEHIDELKQRVAESSSADERRSLTLQLAGLVEPVHEIFTSYLVPRLESLPTRLQRKSALEEKDEK